MSSTPSRPANLIVFISGNGSNLQALIDATRDRSHALSNTKILLVVSNRAKAYGNERAQQANIPLLVVPPFKKNNNVSRDMYDLDVYARIDQAINQQVPDLLVLAGWMHILSSTFINKFPTDSIINLHPGLPGGFVGTNCIEKAYEQFMAGQLDVKAGCMVHFVTDQLDLGQCILAHKVDLFLTDSLTQFADRVHVAEHVVLVDAVVRVLKDRELIP